MDQRALFKEVTSKIKQNKPAEALGQLRETLRRGELDADGVEKAGRICNTAFEEWVAGATSRGHESVTARVLLLGQCTTSWLTNALTAIAWGRGSALPVVDGAYDNVLQELAGRSSASKFDVVVLLPWTQRLLGGDSRRSFEQRVDDEIGFWNQAWQLASARGARILQVGYDWVTPGTLGHSLSGKEGGDIALVRRVNEGLLARLPSGGFFLDLEQVSGVMGRELFYDPRRYVWTKQPFSEDGTVRLAEHMFAGVRALMHGPKKVLVLDLDNTLWGGVVGEVGPLGIELGDGPDGEAYRAFQRHLKKLTERGILLTVCSKNNDADAREPFEKNPNMVLSLDDFAHFEATWDPKSAAITRTSQVLQLGLDSFVFFDDNPAEREHVRQLLGTVEVADVPQDPAEYVRALERGLWFEAVGLTGEDRARAGQYRAEALRREDETRFGSIDDYLDSLEMLADVRSIDDPDLDRVVQLIGKTNQFNLTTRRHSISAVREMLADPYSVGLSLRVEDRFGDHGLVAVLIAVREPHASTPTLRIDTWLMSCRVISRTVEEFLFNRLMDEARGQGVERLVGEYVPSPKNALVKDLLDRFGFTRRPTDGGGTTTYDLDLSDVGAVKTFVRAAALPLKNSPQ